MLKNILLNKKRDADAIIAKAKRKEDAENLSKCKSYVSDLFEIRAKDFSLQHKDNYIRVDIDEYVFRYYANGTKMQTRTRDDLYPKTSFFRDYFSFGSSRKSPTFYQINTCPDCNNEIYKRVDDYVSIEKLDLDKIEEHYCGSDEEFAEEKGAIHKRRELEQKQASDKKIQKEQLKTRCLYCQQIVSSERATCEKCGAYLDWFK